MLCGRLLLYNGRFIASGFVIPVFTLFILYSLSLCFLSCRFPRFPLLVTIIFSGFFFTVLSLCVYVFFCIQLSRFSTLRFETGRSHKFFIIKSECDTRYSRMPAAREKKTVNVNLVVGCFMAERVILACVTVFPMFTFIDARHNGFHATKSYT